MVSRMLLAAALALFAATPASAGDAFRAGVGAFVLGGGADLHLSYRPTGQHWAYGLRYLRWVDTFVDPFTGNDLTETTNEYVGPTVDYRFAPEARHGWYLSVAALRASKSEHAFLTDEVGTDEEVSLYVGGGWSGVLGDRGYYDLGMMISPGAELATATSVSSEEESGLFDIRLIIGVRF